MRKKDAGLVWLIGGGVMAKPMMTEIKQRGYKLMVTDFDPRCPGAEMADEFILLDVYDHAGHLALAESLKRRGPPAGVLTIGTDAGVSVAETASIMGLPGLSPHAARRVKDKTIMRRRLREPPPLSLPLFPDVILQDSALAAWAITTESFGLPPFPCVFKAARLSASRGFKIIENEQRFRDEYAHWPWPDLLVEEYLEGQDLLPSISNYDTSEIALDFLICDQGMLLANSALRLFWRDRQGIEAGHINPCPEGIIEDELLSLAHTAAERLGVGWGPFKIDFKRDRRYGWVILECATRLSGGFDHSHTCPKATGKDVTGAMLDMALTGACDSSKLEAKRYSFACALAPRFKPGKVRGWEVGSVQTFHILAENEIRPLASNADRPLFLIVTGNSPAAALRLAETAATRVKAVYRSTTTGRTGGL